MKEQVRPRWRPRGLTNQQLQLQTKRKEKMRTEEFCKAFDKLKSAIPLHPKVSLSVSLVLMKMSQS